MRATGVLKLDDRDLYDRPRYQYIFEGWGFGVLAFPNPQMIDPLSRQDIPNGDRTRNWFGVRFGRGRGRGGLPQRKGKTGGEESIVLWNRKL